MQETPERGVAIRWLSASTGALSACAAPQSALNGAGELLLEQAVAQDFHGRAENRADALGSPSRLSDCHSRRDAEAVYRVYLLNEGRRSSASESAEHAASLTSAKPATAAPRRGTAHASMLAALPLAHVISLSLLVPPARLPTLQGGGPLLYFSDLRV